MSARLKILHVASWYPSEVHQSLGNFVERHVEAVARQCDVEVWAPVPVKGSSGSVLKMKGKNGTEVREVDGQTWTVRRLYHEATRPQLLGVARSVAGAAQDMAWTPDVVHVHVAYPAGLAALAWAQRWGAPVVLTEHWTAYHEFKALPWWRRRVVRDVVKGVDAVCPVSADLGEAMRAAVPAMGPMVRVVPNVVDTDLFGPAKEERLAGVPVGATRRKMEGHSMERILHVSSMNDEQKNITGLLSALSPILKSNGALRATFVGGEKAHLDTHRQWVSQEGLDGRIEFTGPLDTDQVVQHMQTHDVLVLNSRRENFPCVIPEAWACGLPVMSTDVGGIREHLPSGISPLGFLLPAQAGDEDWSAAWDLVAKAQWNPDTLRGHAVHRFSMDAVGMAYLDVYRSLVG